MRRRLLDQCSLGEQVVPTIAIQLNPALLSNPDLDLRFVLPETIEARSGRMVSDDGFDYGRTSDRMTVFLRTADVEASIPAVLDALDIEILGNRLLEEGVIVATAAQDHCHDENEYTVVYPTESGAFSLE
jgi:hypothetical protein